MFITMCPYIENNNCSWKHSLVPDGDQGQRTGGEPLFTELPRRGVLGNPFPAPGVLGNSEA